MTQEEAKAIITGNTLEIKQSDNGNEYVINFYKTEHLLTGISVSNFSTSSFADYITQIFSPEEQLNTPNFFNIIEEGTDGEIYIFTILVLVVDNLANHQSLCVSQDNKELLHLVTLDEFFSPNINNK